MHNIPVHTQQIIKTNKLLKETKQNVDTSMNKILFLAILVTLMIFGRAQMRPDGGRVDWTDTDNDPTDNDLTDFSDRKP